MMHLAAFFCQKGEIGALDKRLQSHRDDPVGVAPDEVSWGDVGSLDHHAELLKRIADMAFPAGEHAA